MNRLINVIYLITILAVSYSCNQEENFKEIKDISVTEVEQFFDENYSGPTNARKGATSDILWQLGQYRDISLGDAIVFPLDYGGSVFITDSTKSQILSLESNSYAFAYKLDNNIQLEIVRTVPTANTDLFTGNILVENWEGNKLRFFKYENGEFISEHEFYEDSNKNGRVENFENVYTCTTTIYYTCWGDIPHDCRETDRTTTCVLKEIRQIAGPGTNGEDYGGGGSGGSTPVTCSDGYFADANGNCIVLCPYGYEYDTTHGCVKEKPCDGDPLINMVISDYNSGKNANRYGCVRKDPTKTCNNIVGDRFHAGIDLQTPIGTPVYSLVNGTVFASSTSNYLGNYIIIKSNDLYFLYAHLDSVPSVAGTVTIGQFLGLSGESATEGEPHLHLEVKKQNGNESYNNMENLNIEDYLGTNFDNNGNNNGNTNC